MTFLVAQVQQIIEQLRVRLGEPHRSTRLLAYHNPPAETLPTTCRRQFARSFSWSLVASLTTSLLRCAPPCGVRNSGVFVGRLPVVRIISVRLATLSSGTPLIQRLCTAHSYYCMRLLIAIAAATAITTQIIMKLVLGAFFSHEVGSPSARQSASTRPQRTLHRRAAGRSTNGNQRLLL